MRSIVHLKTGDKKPVVPTHLLGKNSVSSPTETSQAYQGTGYSFGRINVLDTNEFSTSPIRIQPKLAINQPGDKYEQEADAMADKVIRMKDDDSSTEKAVGLATTSIVQRKCQHCEDEEESVQRKESSVIPPNMGQTETYIGSLSGGRPLSAGERSFFEPRMGYDFSKVRLHIDSQANQSAKRLNALAYTHGSNIVFNSGEYQPGTDKGKRLLAHELTHVLQQNHNIIQRASASSCCNAGSCATPDIAGSGSPSAYKFTLAVDVEEEGLSRLKSGDVGHTWVKLDADDGTHHSYGFWPQTAFGPGLDAAKAVPGCVHHPDTAHEPPAAIKYNEITYSITSKGYTDALDYADSKCKTKPDYALFSYNCTTFAIEMARKAGISPPSSTSLAIHNPNALSEGIDDAKKAARKAAIKATRKSKVASKISRILP